MHRILSTLRPDTLIWSLGDDMRVTEPGTLARLVREFHARFPDRDGVVNPNDGIQNGRVTTLPLCTARVMADNTPREFFHNFADDVMTERLSRAGKYAYLPDVRVVAERELLGQALVDPIRRLRRLAPVIVPVCQHLAAVEVKARVLGERGEILVVRRDRKSTRLNSSHRT